MKKKLTIALLVFSMLLMLLPTTAFAADSDFVIKDHTLVEYTGSDEFVEIPDGVTAIASGVFRDCTTLQAVLIPGTVQTVGAGAFQGCTSLETLIIEDGTTSVGDDAFAGCTALTDVLLADSITSIGSTAFRGCTSLEYIALPIQLATLGRQVFQDCTSLGCIWIYDELESIANDTFDGCGSNLVIVCAPGSAAEALAEFLSVPYESSLPSIGTWVGDFYLRRQTVCGYEGTGGDITLPKGATALRGDVFQGNRDITSVTIPDGYTEIASSSFFACTNLRTVTLPEGLNKIGSNAFEDCRSLTSVNIPKSVTTIGVSAFNNCESLTSVVLPEGLDTIDFFVFCICRSLVSVNIPSSVTSIGKLAFGECSSLKAVTIPAAVTSIGSKSFAYCDALTSVTIANPTAEIGANAFQQCSALTIYGYSGSTAEQYAKDNNIPFQVLGSADQTPSGGTADATSFSDVKPTDYFYQGVQWAVEQGITDGVGGGRFAPERDCTVPEILTFLWRSQGCPSVAGVTNPYGNLHAGDYYYDAVLWAYSKGIYQGETFDPDQLCTRSMTVEFFWRLAGCPASAADTGLADVPSDASYAPAVSWALAHHVTDGTGANTFSPALVCSRGQIVTFLYRLSQITE